MESFDKAMDWIKRNSIEGKGIIVSSKKRVIYPEVTGYYIPSLLKFNEVELAESYARYMCEIQTSDGAWLDSDMKVPFIFDSGQVLKGLMAIYDHMPEVKPNIIKGIDWILSNMDESGRLIQHNSDVWGKDGTHCNDLIHLYVLSPIYEAAEKFGIPEYKDKADKILNYYVDNNLDKILNYSMFSHFYAYVIEALVDCNRRDLAKKAMEQIEKYTKANGAIKAYNNVNWCCSVATFQFAVIWYKLGRPDLANRSYEYMCSLQNSSGGWYGSYYGSALETFFLRVLAKLRLTRNLYAYDREVSWANKFFLDATFLKNKLTG